MQNPYAVVLKLDNGLVESLKTYDYNYGFYEGSIGTVQVKSTEYTQNVRESH